MTNRHSGYVVVLEKDIREDDAESIINAIRMVKGVLDVKPVIGGADVLIAQVRAESAFRDKLVDTFFPQARGSKND